MRKFVSFSVCTSLLIGATTFGAPLLTFFDLPSFIIVLGVVFGGIFWSHSPSQVGAAIVSSNGMFSSAALGEADAQPGISVFSRASNLASAAGMLGVLIGSVAMLTNLADPSKIGPAMAVALLTLQYGLFLSVFVFGAAVADLECRSALPTTPCSTPFALNVRALAAGCVVIALLLWAMAIVGPVIWFFNGPSAILVIGLISGGIFWSHSPADIRQAIGACCGPATSDETTARRGFAFFSRLSELALAAGAIGTLIGLTQMLQQMDDPTKIGPAMAVALLTILYGVFLSEVVFASAGATCLARAGLKPVAGQTSGMGRLMSVVGPVAVVMFIFFLLLTAMCPGWGS